MVPISSGSDLVYLFTNILSPVDEERSTFPSSLIWSNRTQFMLYSFLIHVLVGRSRLVAMVPLSSGSDMVYLFVNIFTPVYEEWTTCPLS